MDPDTLYVDSPLLKNHTNRKHRIASFCGLGSLCLGLILICNYISNRTPLTTKSYKVPISDLQGSLLSQCDEYYFEQQLSHFSERKSLSPQKTFKQRYFICAKKWRKNNKKPGPIFFYVGNEADVELYLNHTGLMWENADEFGAMLVFAEHRYFGKSVVNEFISGNPKNGTRDMSYLSSEEALADYAVLIAKVKSTYNASSSPVIGFGGSYGGMLASWFRMKYPHIIDGVIAGSAPILMFLGENPPMNTGAFSEIVTFDASTKAGSSPYCVENIRSAWPHIFSYSKSIDGRAKLSKIFRLCKELRNEKEAISLSEWIKTAYDYMSMGNYPYPSSYIMNGLSTLPAFPMRAACEHIGKKKYNNRDSLLNALSKSISVYYNSSSSSDPSLKSCYNISPPNPESKKDADYWDYLYCTEFCQPTSLDGKNDMFWKKPVNWTQVIQSCYNRWGITPRLSWGNIFYGGRKALHTASNIVFSNGNYDPWSGYGVTVPNKRYHSSIIVLNIDKAAHHLDLMFSNPMDTDSVKHARDIEKKNMWTWVKEAYDR